ncbi:cytochrome P450 [Mycobacterium koreense]|nr:cytochrome P450 [Mycolicibacillus koreensis]BBY54394.1 hypothetical protein MKOR_16450 [Mycolicibacillus koreensis]
MAVINTPQYLLDRARRRLTPTLNNLPGMGALEKRLLAHRWKPKTLADPPDGSGLAPIVGDSGLPLIAHMVELFRGGPDYPLHLYRTHGPLFYNAPVILPGVIAVGTEATQAVLANRNKDFSQKGWHPIIGPFFNRGLMLLDFEDHLAHKRIMQEAFTRSRLASYVEHIDRVVSAVVSEWPVNDARFLCYPATKELTLDVASLVFMGHELGADRALVTRVNRAFTATTRAGSAMLRFPAPPFKWWRGLRGRKLLEKYFYERVAERRHGDGTDLLTVLCHAVDSDGNRFSDDDIVSHMIFLMMAAHDTSTSAISTMIYQLAAHPEWQQRCRDESARLGDGPLDIGGLEKLESLDLVMKESLRMVTPLHFVMRQSVRDTELLGHYLPAGTNVMLWPSANHRIPELWTDPETFDPDRFAEPRSEHKRHRYAYAPFGGGAHKCIGMVFAQLEVKTVLHRLLQRYQLELPRPGYRPHWDYAAMPVPIDGMPIVLRPRDETRKERTMQNTTTVSRREEETRGKRMKRWAGECGAAARVLASRSEGKTGRIYDIIGTQNLFGEESLFINFGYWKNAPSTLDEASRDLARLVARAADFTGTDTVVDCGPGYGDQDILWSNEFGVSQITGVNVATEQIAIAESRVAEAGLADRIAYVNASATALPFDDESCTKVVALESAFHFPSRVDFFAEAMRVLKPGGRLVTADIVPKRTVLNARFRRQVDQLGWRGASPKAVRKAANVTAYRDLLADAGFSEVHTESIAPDVFRPLARFLWKRLWQPDMKAVNPVLRWTVRPDNFWIHETHVDYILAVGVKAG